MRLTRHALDAGCGGVLMLPPFYYKGVSDDGVFASIAEPIERIGDARLRVYLYHIPPMAGVGFSLDVVERLIEACPGAVVGLKDSSGDWSNTEALIRAFPGVRGVLRLRSLPARQSARRRAGCITATGNVNLANIRQLYTRWRAPEADALQAEITALRETVQARPMIPALKAILAAHRGSPGWRAVRPPLVALDAAEAAALVAALRAHDFALAA